jgi:hypothetical protein
LSAGKALRGFLPVGFGFTGTLTASISSFSFFNLLNSPIHCSNVKLLTFDTFTVRSSQLFASPFQK